MGRNHRSFICDAALLFVEELKDEWMKPTSVQVSVEPPREHKSHWSHLGNLGSAALALQSTCNTSTLKSTLKSKSISPIVLIVFDQTPQTYAGVIVSILIPMNRFFIDLTSERDSS